MFSLAGIMIVLCIKALYVLGFCSGVSDDGDGAGDDDDDDDVDDGEDDAYRTMRMGQPSAGCTTKNPDRLEGCIFFVCASSQTLFVCLIDEAYEVKVSFAWYFCWW